jgi:hypothetical protein
MVQWKWLTNECCGLNVSPLPHLPPLMTAATCCFIVTAGASSHSWCWALPKSTKLSPRLITLMNFLWSAPMKTSSRTLHRLASGKSFSYTRWWHTVTRTACVCQLIQKSLYYTFDTTGPTTGKNAMKFSHLIRFVLQHWDAKIIGYCYNQVFNGTCYYRKPNVLFMITAIKLRFFLVSMIQSHRKNFFSFSF